MLELWCAAAQPYSICEFGNLPICGKVAPLATLLITNVLSGNIPGKRAATGYVVDITNGLIKL